MAFKMKGWNAGVGTGSHSAFTKKSHPYKQEEKMYGGDGRTWGEVDADNKGNLNVVTNAQKAYEKKKLKEDPNWNKREDNIWKSRQNKINEMAGSSKRYEVDKGTKTKESVTENNKYGGDTKKTVDKERVEVDTDGDGVVDETVTQKNKNKNKTDEDGNVREDKNVLRNVDEEGKYEQGREKEKNKYDEDGNLIAHRGYATGDKKDEEFKENKKAKKNEAKINRLKAKLEGLDSNSKKYKRIMAQISSLQG